MDLPAFVKTKRGVAAELARHLRIHPVMVSQWCRDKKPIAAEHGPGIEQFSDGQVPVEVTCPLEPWSRIPDPAWPHPAGRPVIDHAKRSAIQPTTPLRAQATDASPTAPAAGQGAAHG